MLSFSFILIALVAWIIYSFLIFNTKREKQYSIIKFIERENKSCKYLEIKTKPSLKDVSFEITEKNALNLLSETDFDDSQ